MTNNSQEKQNQLHFGDILDDKNSTTLYASLKKKTNIGDDNEDHL